MEVNTKVKELEEELKLLKAEIRNVLVDIREVILDRSNPLGEEHESAFVRMDLNTTARAMAAEAGAHEAMKAAEHAAGGAGEPAEAADGAPGEEAEFGAFAGPPPEVHPDEVEDLPANAEAEAAAHGEEPAEDEPPPRVIRRDLRQASVFEPETATMEQTEIPPMYMAGLPPLSGGGCLSDWVTGAMDTIGPQDLERVIAMHRLWGALPPNLSRALAHLQELLHTSQETRPPWLKVLRDLDKLASL